MMMMSSGRAGGGATAGRYPFTASQWQELEHQALIYKCLASGKPIPSYLMPPLRRILDSALATSPSLAYPPQPSLGWGCFGMGFSRKADEDPEPGRCRRTDGKKWRCSKEAYPDSKYCEKHMHRGKNRSRKPVEMSLATPAPAPASSPTTAAAAASTTSSPAPSYHRPPPAAHDATPSPYHALYGGCGGGPYSASARPATGGGAYHHAPQQVSPFHLHLETTHPHPPPSYHYSADQRAYAYGPAAAKEVGEHAFFSDGAGVRDRQAAAGQWQFRQLGVEAKPDPTPLFHAAGYGHGAASPYGVGLGKEVDEEEERRRQQPQHQHCFVLGADLRLERPSSGGHDDAAPAQKPLRPFFDEWPHQKGAKAGSWMGLDGETQLSMSIPMAPTDLPVTSRFRNDE